MYAKEKILLDLRGQGLNTFDFEVCESEADLLLYHIHHKVFTIRFSKKTVEDGLPFYCINESTSEDTILHIAKEAHLLECGMICSAGCIYKHLQICNFVFTKEPDGRFLLEFHIGAEALRNMYSYPTSCILGNIYAGTEEFEREGYNTHGLGYSDLKYILDFIERVPKFNKNIECTLYQKEVGVLGERVVVWGVS